jgi:hypothetical protein
MVDLKKSKSKSIANHDHLMLGIGCFDAKK